MDFHETVILVLLTLAFACWVAAWVFERFRLFLVTFVIVLMLFGTVAMGVPN